MTKAKQILNNIYEASNNKLIITISSGINADGFAIAVAPDVDAKPVYSNQYHYGYTASYSKEIAGYSQKEHDLAVKHNWSRVPPVKPFTTDIIKDVMSKYNISRDNIIVKVGKSVFSGKDLNSGEAKTFTDKYLNF